MIIPFGSPSPAAIVVVNPLRAIVAKALDKKLGHYYVSWENDRVVFIGDDAPQAPQSTL